MVDMVTVSVVMTLFTRPQTLDGLAKPFLTQDLEAKIAHVN